MKASFLVATIAAPMLAMAVTWSYPTSVAAKDKFGPWGPPVNLGPIVNSTSHDERPAISRDDLSLYFDSNGREDLAATTSGSLIEPALMISGAGRKTSDPLSTPSENNNSVLTSLQTGIGCSVAATARRLRDARHLGFAPQRPR
jgi:hypothetical protein